MKFFTSERQPNDGRPYYCALCGLGFGEFLACEDGDCRLESEADALKRAKPKRPKRPERLPRLAAWAERIVHRQEPRP